MKESAHNVVAYTTTHLTQPTQGPLILCTSQQ